MINFVATKSQYVITTTDSVWLFSAQSIFTYKGFNKQKLEKKNLENSESTVLCKMFRGKLANQVKLNKTEKL